MQAACYSLLQLDSWTIFQIVFQRNIVTEFKLVNTESELADTSTIV